MRCPSCHLMIDPRTAWKSSNNRFYCSEFCADSEISAPFERCVQKEIHDRHIWTACDAYCRLFMS